MLSIRRIVIVGLTSTSVFAATAAQAGTQLFEGSWTVKAFGNELTGGTGASERYSAWAIPQGILCNQNQPRCPFSSTPTDGSGAFTPLGGSPSQVLFCAPWADWQGSGTTERPAKGATPLTSGSKNLPIPPLYRNPAFFTPGGQPETYSCTATSRSATPGGKGLVQAGMPITGRWGASTTGTQHGGFNFSAASASATGGITTGVRAAGVVGEFAAVYPYLYSYTYATLRNDAGAFGPGQGPGNFNFVYTQTGKNIASINVKQGAAKFGGTMKMLGALTTKTCYFRNGGCTNYLNNWRYEEIGAPAYTSGGVVTKGFRVTYGGGTTLPYSSSAAQLVSGYRFPWTTGSVTVTAVGRGPHKTVHFAKGYDNRNTTTPSGKGVVQLVTPVITRWLQPGVDYETAGIGILRIEFIPEPQAWLTLIVGASLLCVGARMRGR
jgi:hypothetical protein